MAVRVVREPKPHLYTQTTQKDANKLSPYSSGRNYQYSNYQQLINMMATQFDNINDELLLSYKNRFPFTFNVESPDVIYSIPRDDNANSAVYTGDNILPKSTNTSLFDWLVHEYPTGVDLLSTSLASQIVISKSDPNDVEYIDEVFNIETGLYISLTGVASYIHDVYNEPQTPTKVVVTGKGKHGEPLSEEFLFTYPTFFKSSNTWKSVEDIKLLLHDDNSKFTLRVASYISMPDHIEDKYLKSEASDGIIRPRFWRFDDTIDMLISETFAAKDSSDYAAGIDAINTLAAYDLYYKTVATGTRVLDPDCIYPDEYSNILYVVHDGGLLGYNKYDEFPNSIKYASQIQTADPIVKLDVTMNYIAKTVTFKGVYNNVRLNTRVHKYRFMIPDEYGGADIVTDYNTSATTYYDPIGDNGWTIYDPADTIGFVSPEVTLGEAKMHDYFPLYIRLDIMTTDGDIETDTFAYNSEDRWPVFQFPLPAEYTSDMILSRSHNGVLMLDNGTTQLELYLRNDTHFMDPDGTKILVRENYPGVANRFDYGAFPLQGQYLTPTVHNVFNELDQYGLTTTLERSLGEKNHRYAKRLNNAFYNKANSTHNGMIYNIANELDIPIKDYFTVTDSSAFDLSISNGVLIFDGDTYYLHDLDTYGTIGTVLGNIPGFPSYTKLDTSLDDLPATALMDSSNVKYYNNLYHGGQSTVYPVLAKDEYIKSVEMEGYQLITPISDLDKYDRDNPGYYILNGKAIVFSHTLPDDDLVSFETYSTKAILKVSPIIISTLKDSSDFDFDYDYTSNSAQAVIDESERRYPTKFNY